MDTRIATMGHRLSVAGLDLCAVQEWRLGLTPHALSQYAASHHAQVSALFGLERGPAILALAEDGPAARSGLRPDDVILSIDGEAPPTSAAGAGAGRFDEVAELMTLIERAMADGVATLAVLRGDTRLTLEARGERGCASRFVLVHGRGLSAVADGRYVQVVSGVLSFARDEDELASVLAHELAHNALRHRARLDEAGIDRGFLQNFGRSARLTREAEEEADRLSLYLMARAGYDPAAALRYLERALRRPENWITGPTHPGGSRRLAAMRSELAEIARLRQRGEPLVPPFLRARRAAAEPQVDRNQRSSPSSPNAVSRPDS